MIVFSFSPRPIVLVYYINMFIKINFRIKPLSYRVLIIRRKGCLQNMLNMAKVNINEISMPNI